VSRDNHKTFLWNPARPGAREQMEALRDNRLEMTIVEWALYWSGAYRHYSAMLVGRQVRS
jgi:hypothetical protein